MCVLTNSFLMGNVYMHKINTYINTVTGTTITGFPFLSINLLFYLSVTLKN